MTPAEVRDRGLLELVNRKVLHPKGYALGVEGSATPEEGLQFKELAVFDYGQPVTYDGDEVTTLLEASTRDRSTI